MQNARAMFWIYVLENALTVIAALVLDPVLGVPGLALAWVGPYTVAALWPPMTCAGGWARSAGCTPCAP